MVIENLKLALKNSFNELINGSETEKRNEVNQYLIDLKLKNERNKRVWLEGKQKEDEEKEKIRKAEQRIFNSAEKKRKKRLKDFNNFLAKKGNYGYGKPEFLSDQPFALIDTQVTYKNLFSLEGDFLTRATDIQFGRDGLIYTHDKLHDFHFLFHYDLLANKLEKLQLFFSLKEFKFKIYELDPDGMLGFKLLMFNHELEEYRVSKLTPEELLAEQKEKERIAEEKRKANDCNDDDFFDIFFNS